MAKITEKQIAEILQDLEWIPSADFVVETKGVLFRINPKWAKDKAKEITELLKT